MHLFVLIVIEINLLCICVEFIFNSISVNSCHSSSSILWHEANLIQIQTHELKEASSEFCPTLLSIVLFFPFNISFTLAISLSFSSQETAGLACQNGEP